MGQSRRIYRAAIITPLARQLDKHSAHVLTRNSWGDAIFDVLDDVLAAAECALAMQMTMEAVDRAGLGFPIDLNLRIALHFGLIRAVFDPIQGQDTYMGVQIVQAARMEPVTEPGMTYVTEAFAAALASLPGTPFACDYLGEVDTAKGFGRLSLYALRAGRLNFTVTSGVGFGILAVLPDGRQGTAWVNLIDSMRSAICPVSGRFRTGPFSGAFISCTL